MQVLLIDLGWSASRDGRACSGRALLLPLSMCLLLLLSTNNCSMESLLSCGAPWWNTRWGGQSKGVGFNKLAGGALLPLFTHSSCHGGGRWGLKLECGPRGRTDEARLRSQHAKDKFANAICGRRRLLRAVVVGWDHGFFFLKAFVPLRMIFSLGMTFMADGDPSGVIHGVVVDHRDLRLRQLSCG